VGNENASGLFSINIFLKVSEKQLNKILNGLNKNIAKLKKLMFIRPLSESVDYAKFWDEEPLTQLKKYSCSLPDKCYLIKDVEKNYVGIVLDMSHDLHWYVKKEHRGKGYLTKSLKEIIIPHLLDIREEQKITISKNEIGLQMFKSSEKVALSNGFKLIKIEDEKHFYSLKREELIEHPIIEGKNTLMSEERMLELKRTFSFMAHKLNMIEAEIELHTDDVIFSEDISELSAKMSKYSNLIEDKWYETYSKPD
jgi:hypothetical protein